MKNRIVAKKLNKIASFLELDEVDYKPQAYRRAASSVLNLEKKIKDIYDKEGREGLKSVSGVGKNIADKIEEFLLTGEIEYLSDLQDRFSIDLENLSKVEGIGPKRIKDLYDELGIEDLQDLEREAKSGSISELEGFGEKTEKNILEALKFLKKNEERQALGEALPIAREIRENLQQLDTVEKISFAGSIRRKKETVGDVDILVSANHPEEVMDAFTSFPFVLKVLGKGRTKSSIRLEHGFDVDLRVVDQESFGAALQYFTGSKEHNIQIRQIAIEKGCKLNEYGLFREEEKLAGEKEEDIYSTLELGFPPPEVREDQGEIKRIQEGDSFSQLCTQKDLKGDLHVHTDWTGGANSLEEVAQRAEDIGYSYIGISDHTKFLKIEDGLDEEELEEQRKMIKELDTDIEVLQGCEANILEDGSLDINDKALEKLDYVIAGIHSKIKMNEEEMTKRIVESIRHPQVDIIAHPLGRLIKKRHSISVDIDKLLEVAQEEDVALEINSSPARLDLKDDLIRKCVDKDIKLVINSDAHHKNQLTRIEFGVGQARRGWATKKDIINTYQLNNLLTRFS